MIKTYQTKTVANDGEGDCLAACIASILERPLRHINAPSTKDPQYWSKLDTSLARIGYRLVRPKKRPKGYAIAYGPGERIYPAGHDLEFTSIIHAVVVFNGQLIHDPFPFGEGLTEVTNYYTLEHVSEPEEE